MIEEQTSEPNEKMALRKELEQFRREKEQIRTLVGQIGGKDTNRLETYIQA